MGLGIPPLNIKIMLESNPLKSTMLVGRLAVLSVLLTVIIALRVVIIIIIINNCNNITSITLCH